ncbi:hypothetical protein M406DRAFT_357633 [Cryphonectria parasitica EP155]|uniref:Uncharacterized protein n=1 Tax=Cryphonectria parasitica (strain ATCC 38755 / EP155) TaxID=660469 RepID=A0A9P4XXV1_CRYP1|nr:uncharacterized protein M406DRAFT_357633 [Cryphonectria parasitica EP155]KAF3762908.1 hypothetical protein M406DRAFT_357633 [Cryphonectria parasitica EP155]
MAETGEPLLPPSNEYLQESVYVPAEPKWEYKMSNLVWYQARGEYRKGVVVSTSGSSAHRYTIRDAEYTSSLEQRSAEQMLLRIEYT